MRSLLFPFLIVIKYCKVKTKSDCSIWSFYLEEESRRLGLNHLMLRERQLLTRGIFPSISWENLWYPKCNQASSMHCKHLNSCTISLAYIFSLFRNLMRTTDTPENHAHTYSQHLANLVRKGALKIV